MAYKKYRGGSRAAATYKMERHKALHLECCSSPRSASEVNAVTSSDKKERARIANIAFIAR